MLDYFFGFMRKVLVFLDFLLKKEKELEAFSG